MPDDLEFRTAVGQVSPSVLQHVSFVVPIDHAPVFRQGTGHDAFGALTGLRPPVDDVARAQYPVGTPAVDMIQDGFQRVQVAVYVGENGDLHGFRNRRSTLDTILEMSLSASLYSRLPQKVMDPVEKSWLPESER